MYLVCWNHNCRQTYNAENYKPTDRNVKCDKCGDTLISNSGEVTLSGISNVMKTIDSQKLKES